jgi:hypothetical protein
MLVGRIRSIQLTSFTLWRVSACSICGVGEPTHEDRPTDVSRYLRPPRGCARSNRHRQSVIELRMNVMNVVSKSLDLIE